MSGYAVVQFTEWGDRMSTEAIPVLWITKTRNRELCHYPKTGGRKAIKNCSTLER